MEACVFDVVGSMRRIIGVWQVYAHSEPYPLSMPTHTGDVVAVVSSTLPVFPSSRVMPCVAVHADPPARAIQSGSPGTSTREAPAATMSWTGSNDGSEADALAMGEVAGDAVAGNEGALAVGGVAGLGPVSVGAAIG